MKVHCVWVDFLEIPCIEYSCNYLLIALLVQDEVLVFLHGYLGTARD
ncbi:hypothetical protein Leryth_024317 [Lithospermum erythrorhizon]|nr:hypothetical protein Leryth_024317 [Lithospermum erythrorhizon]